MLGKVPFLVNTMTTHEMIRYSVYFKGYANIGLFLVSKTFCSVYKLFKTISISVL